MKPDNTAKLPLTSVKIMINEWVTLRAVIHETTKRVQDQFNDNQSRVDPTLAFLTDTQINDAIHGPFHALVRQSLSAHSMLSEAFMRLNLNNDEFKQVLNLHLTDADKQKPKAKLVTDPELNKIKAQLQELTSKHFEQWKTLTHKNQDAIIATFNSNKLMLSETEIKELTDNDPLSELRNRFTDLTLPFPKLKKDVCDVAQYLQSKTILTVRNLLGRQHQPNEQANINRIMKKFKSNFDQINKDEKALIKTQQEETQNILSPLR
jgi:hypothetical protein